MKRAQLFDTKNGTFIGTYQSCRFAMLKARQLRKLLRCRNRFKVVPCTPKEVQ